ncbi:MAG TPA: peptidylprolyl isomerase [Kiritimatiellia bacterium]|nr:peptidylprolyl isomerase [Kiritimatiellia bacterium]
MLPFRFNPPLNRQIALPLALLALGLTAPADDGLFVDLSTSMGDITAKLDFERAPFTVANFIGLAEGTKAWLDQPTGIVRADPFYDGLIFHRVASNFVIQTGSRNFIGTDDPGYEFRDEFHPDLRHNKPGILSMANSGRHSNGSQFFITAVARPDLDDRHSAFGEVIDGLDVVAAINHVPVDGMQRPLSNVVIHTVTIRRVGQDALDFDPLLYPLPEVQGLDTSIRLVPGTPFTAVPFDRTTNSQEWLYLSTNLVTWQAEKLPLRLYNTTNQTDVAFQVSGSPLFAAASRAVYPEPLFVYSTVLTRGLFLSPTQNTNLTLVIAFGASQTNGAISIYNPELLGTFPVYFYQWNQRPLTGRVNPIFFNQPLSPTNASRITIDFVGDGFGFFEGLFVFDGIPSIYSGTFILP